MWLQLCSTESTVLPVTEDRFECGVYITVACGVSVRDQEILRSLVWLRFCCLLNVRIAERSVSLSSNLCVVGVAW